VPAMWLLGQRCMECDAAWRTARAPAPRTHIASQAFLGPWQVARPAATVARRAAWRGSTWGATPSTARVRVGSRCAPGSEGTPRGRRGGRQSARLRASTPKCRWQGAPGVSGQPRPWRASGEQRTRGDRELSRVDAKGASQDLLRSAPAPRVMRCPAPARQLLTAIPCAAPAPSLPPALLARPVHPRPPYTSGAGRAGRAGSLSPPRPPSPPLPSWSAARFLRRRRRGASSASPRRLGRLGMGKGSEAPPPPAPPSLRAPAPPWCKPSLMLPTVCRHRAPATAPPVAGARQRQPHPLFFPPSQPPLRPPRSSPRVGK